MNNQSNNSFSNTDIQRYHSGAMTPLEMHALERAALDDPFLADALEGYASVQTNQTANITELNDRLDNRISRKDERKIIPINRARWSWLRVAALLILVAGGGVIAYQFQQQSTKDQVATIEKKEPALKKNGSDTIINEANPASDKQLLHHIDSIEPKRTLLPLTDTAITDQDIHPQRQERAGKQNEALASKKSAPLAVPSTAAPGAIQKPERVQAPETEVQTDSGVYSFHTAKPVQLNANTQPRFKSTSENLEKDYSKGAAVIRKDLANTNIFRGQVVDANNTPLPFANVTVTDNHIGTYTDNKGNFVLVSPDSVLQVQIRSVGFENNVSELKNNQTSNTVVLTPDTKNIAATVLSNRQINNVRKRADNVTLEEPEPSDGWDNYDTYLANNISIPEEIKFKPPVNNEVELSFTVNKNGEPVNIKVEKSLCGECDAEAIRLLRQGPRWKKKKNSKAKIAVTF